MYRERALQFGPDGGLVGVLAEPRSRAEGNASPALLLLNAGILHHVGPSRLYVTLARRLAAGGLTSLRFDFSGIGDSDPRRDGLGFDEATVQEVRDAMDLLESRRQVHSFVVGGICSGADAAFRAALADSRVVGLLQVDGYAYRTPRYYFHRFVPKLRHPRCWPRSFALRADRWLSRSGLRGRAARERSWSTEVRLFPDREEVADGLSRLAARGTRQLHVYTGGQPVYQNYADQFWDNFRSVDFRGLARVEYIGEADHVFTGLEQQEHLVDLVASWMAGAWPPERGVPAPDR